MELLIGALAVAFVLQVVDHWVALDRWRPALALALGLIAMAALGTHRAQQLTVAGCAAAFLGTLTAAALYLLLAAGDEKIRAVVSRRPPVPRL